MKVNKWIFFGGIAAGIGYFLWKFSQQIVVAFSGIKWLGREGLKLKFALKYNLTNNNDVSATITGFKGTLFYGEYKLNNVLISTPVTVPPGGTEMVQVDFTVSPGVLLAEILQFLDDKSGFKRFRLRGTMTGKIGSVPWIYPVNENLGLAE